MKRIMWLLIFVILLSIDQIAGADTTLKTVVQKGHSWTVFPLCFSPNMKYLATGSGDNTIKMWEISSGRLIRTFLLDSSCGFSALTFSPGGEYLAALVYGRRKRDTVLNGLNIWRLSDGMLVKTLLKEHVLKEEEYGQPLNPDSFSEDGRYVTDFKGAALKVWHVFDWHLMGTIRTNTKDVISTAFSPDGRYLAAALRNSGLKIWKISDGGLIHHIIWENGKVNAVKFGSKGRLLAALCDKKIIHLWRLSDSKEVGAIEGGFESFHFGPEAQYIATIPKYRRLGDHNVTKRPLKIFSVPDGRLLSTVQLTLGGRSNVAFTPDGRCFATEDKGDVNIWQIKDKTSVTLFRRFDIQSEKFVHSMDFSPDGKHLVSASSGAPGVQIWDLSNGNSTNIPDADFSGVSCVCYSPNAKFLAVCGNKVTGGFFDGFQIKLWNMKAGKTTGTLEAHCKFESISFSPDGRYLLSGSREGVKLWKVSDGSVNTIFKPPFGDRVTSVKFSPDGQYLAAAFASNRGVKEGHSGLGNVVRIWNLPDFSLHATLKGHNFWLNGVDFTPDGRCLASSADDGTIKLWDVREGDLISTLKGHRGRVLSVSFSPGGEYLASGSTDTTVKIWQISSGRLIKSLDEHEFQIMSVKYSPDGKYLASCSWDGKIILREAKTGRLLCTLFPIGKDASLILTPEGFFSGTGDFDRHVHFVKGLDVYDFNQFYDAFYRPDLVWKKLKGEDISKYTAGLNIEDALRNPPPKVTILSPLDNAFSSQRTITVKVQVKDTGGRIGDIRFHHNGKLVDSMGVYRLISPEGEGKPGKTAKTNIETRYRKTRGIALKRVQGDAARKSIRETAFMPAVGTVEKTCRITLMNGENAISVSAFNGTNTVMSEMRSVNVRTNLPERKPELFALVLGNNRFKSSELNLSLAVQDARDFSATLKKVAAPLYGKVRVNTLLNANKAAIVDSVLAMRRRMKPEDVFVFFAATHGWAFDVRYYLYTSDFDGDRSSKESSISSMELMEFSKWLPALKQIFILDTCHAGGMGAAVSGLYDARISVLAKALGMHIFAGANMGQEALDTYKGNGLFTYFIIKGLEGQADQDLNKEVSVVEMKPYLERMVKEAAKGTLEQTPYIRIFGDDFPLSKVLTR